MTPNTEHPPPSVRTLADCGAYWRGEHTGPVVSIVAEPTYRQMLDATAPDLDAVADAAVACIRADLAAGDPFVLPAVYADFGTISTARLYGGKVLPPSDGGKVHIAPVVQRPDDLAGLRACAFEESDFQLALDLWRRVCDRLGTDQVFLRTPDFQGPMNTLALVMNQEELLAGLYEAPAEIHAALDGITATLIDYHRRLRRELGGGRVIGNIWPYTVLPEDLGASLTQDMMPLLSPDLYREFEIPRLRRIGEAFGGLQIHCCGRYEQHLAGLKASGLPIRGLEFHHPFTPFKAIHEVFGDEIVYIPYLFGECKDYPDYVAFADDLMRQGSARTRFWFAMANGWVDADRLRQVAAGGETPATSPARRSVCAKAGSGGGTDGGEVVPALRAGTWGGQAT